MVGKTLRTLSGSNSLKLVWSKQLSSNETYNLYSRKWKVWWSNIVVRALSNRNLWEKESHDLLRKEGTSRNKSNKRLPL